MWAVQRDNLLRIEGTDIKVIQEINGTTLKNNLYSIELDIKENIWLGMNQALGCLKKGKWIIYETRNSGVISDRINQLAIDKEGNVWMGGQVGGLGIFNPSGLDKSYFYN